jgi:hypothetical protein
MLNEMEISEWLRKVLPSFHVNKLQKLADIVSDALATNSNYNSDNPN